MTACAKPECRRDERSPTVAPQSGPPLAALGQQRRFEHASGMSVAAIATELQRHGKRRRGPLTGVMLWAAMGVAVTGLLPSVRRSGQIARQCQGLLPWQQKYRYRHQIYLVSPLPSHDRITR